MSDETWRPIPGHPMYEVSDHGNVRSLRRGDPRPLSTWAVATGHIKVRVGGRATPGQYVHQFVLKAFVGPRPEGMVTRHLNGDPTDNRLENLAWGTQSENNYDAVRHGTHYWARVTHCPRGHEYNEANTLMNNGSRTCRPCARERMRLVRTTNVRQRNRELRAWAAANGYDLKSGRIPKAIREAFEFATRRAAA